MLVSFQTKTYDSVTDKFMDFSFEKVGFMIIITTIIIIIKSQNNNNKYD